MLTKKSLGIFLSFFYELKAVECYNIRSNIPDITRMAETTLIELIFFVMNMYSKINNTTISNFVMASTTPIGRVL